MPRQHSQRQDGRRAGKIVRVVSRLLNDVDALEMLPHRMRRVTQPPMRQSVGEQQLAEFIRHFRMRNGKHRQQRRA